MLHLTNETCFRSMVFQMRLPNAPDMGLSGAGLLWSAIIGAGFYCVLRYEVTPGTADRPPPRWPDAGRVVPQPNRANLVLAAHPRCPCTRATVQELAELMAQEPDTILAHVLVFKPGESEDGWERTDLWRQVAEIEGVEVHTDSDGVEARRFGLRTSGHALLYDRDGQLVFSGGLTDARGHVGASVGRKIIAAILNGKTPERTTTPVYGCSLFGANDRSLERCTQCPQ